MKQTVARTFFVELHLDDILEVLLVVRLKFLFKKIMKIASWILFNLWEKERRNKEYEERVIEVSKSSIWKLKKENVIHYENVACHGISKVSAQMRFFYTFLQEGYPSCFFVNVF